MSFVELPSCAISSDELYNTFDYTDFLEKLESSDYPHAGAIVVTTEIRHVRLPQVGSNEPANGHLYCTDHLEIAKEAKLPVTKKELQQSKVLPDKTRETIFEEELEQVIDDVSKIKMDNQPSCLNKTSVAPWCKKNDGRDQKVGNWSRGYFVFVHACGQISSFSPLYRSESLSQAFVLTLEWLLKILQTFPYPLKEFLLAYDNMCNFARLKALKELLPECLPDAYKNVWSEIRLIIDGLHLRNHKRESCSVDFNPKFFTEAHQRATETNTMAAEQTFSWLGKFKKQVNAMSKRNQLFFLHRIIVRRNMYLRDCLLNRIKPIRNGKRSTQQRAGM